MLERASPTAQGSPVVFSDRVCELTWPRPENQVVIEGHAYANPYRSYRRVALIGDTGCRRKAADQAYQNCDDATEWPFAAVVQSVRAQHPDLVVHVGDLTYRESPCRAGDSCADPAWGYGSDVWLADLWRPAAGLLGDVPWVFVRGNHETCERAGRGWFRYVDPSPWVAGNRCDNGADPQAGNYTPPYQVPLTPTQALLVLDSAASGNKGGPDPVDIDEFYAAQIRDLVHLLGPGHHGWIASHHPMYAMAPSVDGARLAPGNSKVLTRALARAFGSDTGSGSGSSAAASLRAYGVTGLLHGHIHAFEAIDFDEDLPVSLVVGNAGSQMEGRAPRVVPAGFALGPEGHVAHYASQPGFGFALLELPIDDSGDLSLTEFSVQGQALLRCRLAAQRWNCLAPSS